MLMSACFSPCNLGVHRKIVVIVKLEVEGLLSRFLRWPVVGGKEIMVLIDVGKHLEHEFLISCPILEVITQIGVGHR